MSCRCKGVTRCAAVAATIGCAGSLAAHAAERRVTREQAHAVAATINLRPGDLPGAQLGPAVPSDRNASAALARCDGGPPYSDVLADVASRPFVAGTSNLRTLLIISSETEIFPTPALAASDLAASSRPRGTACVLASWRSAMHVKGEVTTGEVSSIARNVIGTGVRAAIRLTFTSRSSRSPTARGTITSRVDLFAFVRGQAETFLTVQTGGAVFSASTEHRLAEILVKRAGAAVG